MSHIPTIQAIYAAFATGDARAILERVSEDVKWEHWENNFAQKAGVPYLQARRGKAGVAEFLSSLAAVNLKGMNVGSLMEGANQVSATFTIELEVKATGKSLRDEEVHVWTLDDSGRVIALRHYCDTAKHIEANRGAL
jgi:ketosteroid isomerase-like protein